MNNVPRKVAGARDHTNVCLVKTSSSQMFASRTATCLGEFIDKLILTKNTFKIKIIYSFLMLT